MRHGDIVDLAVHPEARGHGVGTALAAEVAADGRKVEAWSHGDHPAAARIAERFGIARERELMIMRRSLVEPLEQVVVPPGVTVRGFQPADEAALLEVNASAFAHHPEQGHMTHEDFRERSTRVLVRPRRPPPRRTVRGQRRSQPPRLPLDQGAPRRGPAVRRGLRRRGQPQGRGSRSRHGAHRGRTAVPAATRASTRSSCTSTATTTRPSPSTPTSVSRSSAPRCSTEAPRSAQRSPEPVGHLGDRGTALVPGPDDVQEAVGQ